MERSELKKILEVLIFVSDKPLSVDILKTVLEEDAKSIKDVIGELKEYYGGADKGFNLVEIAGGYQFVTDPKYAPWLKKLYKSKIGKLSMPSLETLAILAYKQPLTRAEVEAIRGVNVDGIMKNLLDKGLVRVCGRKDTPGRPFTYGTTNDFLEYFGLGSLGDLPMQDEFRKEKLGLTDDGRKENIGSGSDGSDEEV